MTSASDTPGAPAILPLRLAALPHWLGIAGPTACGKSALALALAERLAARGLRCELVSVDSAQVYRELNVGSAKPGPAERAALPHHLVDILPASAAYDAGQFVRDAQQLIAAIRARGRLPLLVGGTMLYFHALQNGLAELPPASPALRAELDAQARQHGWPTLHQRLARVDAATAQRLAPNDAQRIQRALEVWQLTGRPLSAWHAQATAAATSAAPPGLLIKLMVSDRAWLHARIAQRFDAMLAAGLIAEVAALRARGDLSLALPAMRSVGYRQVWQALDAGLAGAALQAQVRERGLAATRQLAKRQLTWLRSAAGAAVQAEHAQVDELLQALLASTPMH